MIPNKIEMLTFYVMKQVVFLEVAKMLSLNKSSISGKTAQNK
jgi:hypothetical protein